MSTTAAVLREVYAERTSQDRKWGEQNHPDGTGPSVLVLYGGGSENLDLRYGLELANHFRERCDKRHKQGWGSYLDILLEEVFEAAAENGTDALRAELLQVAAVAVAWVEKLDRGM